MKLRLMFLLSVYILFGLLGLDSSYGGPSRIDLQDVTVRVGTTTAIQVGGWEPSRHYYAVGNWSDTYIIFHATWPIKQTDIQRTPTATGISLGIPLAPYQGSSSLNVWIDNYRIYYSSWFVLVSSAAAPANVTPVAINVTYRQKI